MVSNHVLNPSSPQPLSLQTPHPGSNQPVCCLLMLRYILPSVTGLAPHLANFVYLSLVLLLLGFSYQWFSNLAAC